MGLAFAVFLAGGYHFAEQAAVTNVSAPPILSTPLFVIPEAQGMMTLTVNVDWGSEQVTPILDIFEKHGVKATFFLTGKWAEGNQTLARSIVERGHEVGNHGRSHSHPKQLGDQALTQHIADNAALLKSIVGKVSKLYAPPYGEWDRRVVNKAAALGHYTVLWTIDTIDWQDPPAATIVERVTRKAQAGGIVLMHPKPNTVAALPTMITTLQSKGLRLVTLSEMITAATPGE
jgi:peptidoglycan/xylan/chitin deacetylase (PgdA/CDA1 family)